VIEGEHRVVERGRDLAREDHQRLREHFGHLQPTRRGPRQGGGQSEHEGLDTDRQTLQREWRFRRSAGRVQHETGVQSFLREGGKLHIGGGLAQFDAHAGVQLTQTPQPARQAVEADGGDKTELQAPGLAGVRVTRQRRERGRLPQ